MTARELDRLLAGAETVGVVIASDRGDPPITVWFTRRELESPVAWRSALRRQLGHLGYEPPRYEQEDHDQIVRVLFQAIGLERGPA